MSPTRRALATFVLGAAVVAIAWSARVSEGRKALAESTEAAAHGDLTTAILAARAAAEARCPGCEAPDRGFAQLERIASDAEARGDYASAFAAWRSVRAASLATSVIGTRTARRTRADEELARLGHKLDVEAVAAGALPTAAAAEDRLRQAGASRDVPGSSAYAFLGVGGVLLLVGAARLALAKGSRASAVALALTGAGLAALAVLFF
ncbi:hypothetical protein AKJ09_09132 [Labilithrix luteola]|uniref:Uncharacterized protein n=1 Tax=Labilithrix luteola TaxID=1391654 RepID=A0A0K1Q9Q4_9BACT|nr:hypothetical protein [Labilithrix luteola]AKV02469.1 hypothetical protein AKJ09_09132 [Labilithrix luteola]